MPRTLTKSVEEFLSQNGWSAHKFVKHAVYVHEHFDGEINMGRSVAYARKNGKMVKIYAHHNGRSNEYITITDKKGTELVSIHCYESPEYVLNQINLHLSK
jgi:hypothetical protein